MCGLVFLAGPRANARITRCLDRLRHRGPDDYSLWSHREKALGFVRLEINGTGALGRQPFVQGALVGAFNGEIYNHHALAETHGADPSPCDTRIILPLVERFGPQVIHELDGFYAGVIVQQTSSEATCLRDPIGKKPLFVGRSKSEIFISSELKALDEVDWFTPLPLGASSVELQTGRVSPLADHRPVEPRSDLAEILEDAVRKRLPRAEQPVGVFLSGGLDSSLVAALISKVRADAIHFTLGDPGSPDRSAVATVAQALGLTDVRAVALPAEEHLGPLLRHVVYATESFNPSIVSNGLATYLLAKAAKAAGVKVVLTGEGADELFGGYHAFGPAEPWRQVRRQLIADLQVTELRRLDLSCMAHAIEARCPFLDPEVRSFSDQLDYPDLYCGEINKAILRRRMTGVLPPEILNRKKTSFDVGSGLRAQVVRHLRSRGRSEREELFDLWREHFHFDSTDPYFHAYPAFDSAINVRGEAHR